MKLTVLLLVMGLLQVAARGTAQVTLKETGTPLEKVLKTIKRQSGYDLFFNETLVKSKGSPVHVSVNNVPVDEALKQVFSGQEALTYFIDGKIISIKEKKVSSSLSLGLNLGLSNITPPVTKDISGRVTDEEGNPLARASVVVRGINLATVTNSEGLFVLKSVEENWVIEVSYVGYEVLSLPVRGRTSFAVSLKAKEASLQEVVVNKGYYTEKTKYSVSNVGKVTAREIEKQPVSNPIQSLIGRVPGLYIRQSSGWANGGVTVRIQGQNSIANGGDPFYVVDGVPYLSQMPAMAQNSMMIDLGSSGAAIQAGTGNPLAFINPSDIESIEVLKDADATAIYGSRAANGAILITTKKGRTGKMKVDLGTQRGWSSIPRFLDLLDTKEYLAMRRQAIANEGATVDPTDYDINGVWDTTRYTDWQKVLLGNTAGFTQLNLTLSGGNAFTQYRIGGTFQKQTDVFPGDFSNRKSSLHVSLNSQSENKRFNILFTGSFMHDLNNLPGGGMDANAALRLPPNAPAIYNSDGSFNWAPDPSGSSTWDNPLAEILLRKYENTTHNFISNITAGYVIAEGLRAKINLGYNKLTTDEFRTAKLNSIRPEYRFERGSQFANSNTENWIIEPQIDYSRLINGKHQLNGLVGLTFQGLKSSGEILSANGFTSDDLLGDIRSASVITVSGSEASKYNYNAVFARFSYVYDDKYLLSLTGRRDGSSRFGSNNMFQNFGSIGAGWIFSQEKFVQKAVPVLSFGKIRATYGTTGSDQIGNYRFMNLYSAVSAGIPYNGISVLQPTRHTNPDLQWEVTRKLQLGIDLGFFNDRLSLTANYAINRSSNQLLQTPLATISGFNAVLENLPATIENRSVELLINGRIINRARVAWSSSINLTIPKNKLVDFPGIQNTSYNSFLIVGQPLDILRVYKYLGVDPTSGLYIVADKDGKPTQTPQNADKTVFISRYPKLFGGWGHHVSLGSFELDALFSFSNLVIQDFLGGEAFPGGPFLNQPASVVDRWQRFGDVRPVQRFGFSTVAGSYFNMTDSDARYRNSYFARLTNLSVSYKFSAALMKKIKMQELSVFVHAQNLFTVTGVNVLDPESGTSALPPLRTISAGIKAIF